MDKEGGGVTVQLPPHRNGTKALYGAVGDPFAVIFFFFQFFMVLALTYINISVTVNPGSKLRQFLRHGVSETMSSLYNTCAYR
jgi:hypothetical protein